MAEQFENTNDEGRIDYGINAHFICKTIDDSDLTILQSNGLDENYITDPHVRNMYIKLKKYAEDHDGIVPNNASVDAVWSAAECEYFYEVYQKCNLSSEAIAKGIWKDYVANKTYDAIKNYGPLLESDPIKSRDKLLEIITSIKEPNKQIGVDIVSEPQERLRVRDEKANNTNYFLSTGFNQLDDKIGGGLAPGEDLVVLFARTGVGKEQPLYSKVLTPTGWKRMGDLELKDRVITGSGDIGSVIGIFPQGVKDIYHVVLDDETVVDAGIDHLWEVIDRFSFRNKRKVVSTRDLLNNPKRYRIPVPGSFDIVHNDNSFLSSVFIRIVSAIWSDRYDIQKQSNGTMTATLFGRFGTELSTLGIISYKFNDNGRVTSVSWNCDSDFGKFIDSFLINVNSDHYSFNHDKLLTNIQSNSFELRRTCLSYIIRRWGYECCNHNIYGVVGNKKVFKHLAELVKSVGGLCLKNYEKCNGIYIHYIIKLPFNPYIRSDSMLNSFKCSNNLSHKIERIYKRGRSKCQCIMIDHPDHTYITDGYTVTHNTWILTKMLHNCWKNGCNVGMIEPEMSATKVGYRFDTLDSHFSNKDLMYGRRASEGPDDYARYIETLPEKSSYCFKVAHPKEFGDSITVSRIKQWCESEKLDVLGIDGISYIQDERALSGDNTTTALTHISADLMELSILLKIPILIVVQSNREGTAQGGKLALENIRDSDGIAYSASKVIGLYNKNSALHMQLLKNRDGESAGCLVYDWDINTGKFNFLQEGELDSNQQATPSSHTYTPPAQTEAPPRHSRVSGPSDYGSASGGSVTDQF